MAKQRSIKIKASYDVGFSPDGMTCFSISRNVSLWSIESRKKVWSTHPVSHPSDAAFCPVGDSLAVKSTSGRIVTIDAETGQVIRDFANQAEGEGSNLLFSPCGHYIVDGSWNGIITVRDAHSGTIEFCKKFDHQMIPQMGFVAGANSLVVQHSPRATTNHLPPDHDFFTISEWPLSSTSFVELGIRLPFVTAFDVSAAGDRLAVFYGAPPRDLHIYELPSTRLLWSATGSCGGSGSTVCWSRCGRFLAQVQTGRIVQFDGITGQVICSHSLPYPSDVDYSPDSRWIAYGSWSAGEIHPVDFP